MVNWKIRASWVDWSAKDSSKVIKKRPIWERKWNIWGKIDFEEMWQQKSIFRRYCFIS